MKKKSKGYSITVTVDGGNVMWDEEWKVCAESSKEARKLARDRIKEEKMRTPHLKRIISSVFPTELF